ncbi:phage baseplate assembly protein V [Shimwellia blattae]|uniref:Baseplate assembly protein n=2 Tax=Shimwellia blattae TaxID=563 RepID=Q3ZL18_SHIBL|nr:phage baseplate assembly protein V [Shimwellia blattae]AAX12956.1 baseplate assembly protein [Shimwellia blattae DSM 4481 = NBRC 105725]AFJ48049.1 putative phage baseplate assembly protein V [Shimwellia blattae DSM 4481 = NBRC 105725]VDY65548.1 Mu-like prophage protein gp45 [Shimwellia blattae]VEC24914.1 Mu-like prophage protein gp45 [Shimwellia blattae]GAB81963.1 putative baseplate assembly protein [Shimwellia blattae DSM 4481 = NBRC 105725]
MGLNPGNFSRSLSAVGRRLRLMVDRAVVRMVKDSLGRQNLQVQSLADETNDDVERFQNYGFTSFPPEGAEAIVVAVGGRRSGLVAIAVEDKSARPRSGESGDVCLYHREGHIIRLKKDGVIEITGKKVNLVAEESCDIIGKQINVTGPTTFSEDITVKGKSFLNHIHKDGDGADTTKPL